MLIAPLDWGLGHATRCVPVIKSLVKQGFTVTIAAERMVETLLKNEFPGLEFLVLRGYRIRYSKDKKKFQSKLFSQAPHILKAIKAEHQWLKKIQAERKFDAIISDNRFGLYAAGTPSIFITHQLHIETGNRIFNWLAQKINYHYINKFSECWVPDFQDAPTLAGKLSHPEKLPAEGCHYIGALSRMHKVDMQKTIDLSVLLSGPEPQRTIFENLLLQNILPGAVEKIIFIRGLPGDHELPGPNKNIEFHNHLPAADLENVLSASKKVLARCGYSTVMDLAALQANAILVPTPGQTEQEYLATHLNDSGMFTCVEQNAEMIQNALFENKKQAHFRVFDHSELEKTVLKLKELISKKSLKSCSQISMQ